MICRKCGEDKEEFYTLRGKPLKDCKDCVKKSNLSRYYQNRDQSIKNVKRWKRLNPDKVRGTWKKWYYNNREKRLERRRGESLKTAKHPDRITEQRERRKLYAINTNPELFVDQITGDDPFRCHVCGELKDLFNFNCRPGRQARQCNKCVRRIQLERYHRIQSEKKV